MKLYEIDGHISEFKAIVVSCTQNNCEKYDIILDKSAFFPEGGGQSSDEGFIENHEVIELRLDDTQKNVIHTINFPLEIGSEVNCKINKQKRFSDMQNHTAEHIVSGIIHSKYGYDNIGFHMGTNEVTMDFNGILNNEQLEEIEHLANNVVYQNLNINISFIEPEDANNTFFRSKKEINSTIRLVEIENVDVCACCAPHVSKTGEIGIIKLLGVQKYKGGIRISMLAGERAYLKLNKYFNDVKKISNSLSSHPDKICDNFITLQNEISQLKSEKSLVTEKYYELLSSKYNSNDKAIILFESNVDFNNIRKLVNMLTTKTDGVCACFFQQIKDNDSDDNDINTYSFIIASKSFDLAPLINLFKSKYNSSCGGKNNMFQGTICASRKDINSIIEEFVN